MIINETESILCDSFSFYNLALSFSYSCTLYRDCIRVHVCIVCLFVCMCVYIYTYVCACLCAYMDLYFYFFVSFIGMFFMLLCTYICVNIFVYWNIHSMNKRIKKWINLLTKPTSEHAHTQASPPKPRCSCTSRTTLDRGTSSTSTCTALTSSWLRSSTRDRWVER